MKLRAYTDDSSSDMPSGGKVCEAHMHIVNTWMDAGDPLRWTNEYEGDHTQCIFHAELGEP